MHYSATVGYGVAVKHDYYSDDVEVEQWLEDNNFRDIAHTLCGDWMSGNYVSLFHLPGTLHGIDWGFSGGFVSFDTPEQLQEQELQRLCDELRVGHSSVGWKLVFNVG